jgi:hypothetical protein
MFNQPLLNPDKSLEGGVVINPSDVILYLPLTTDLTDQGYYGLGFTPLSNRGAGYTPIIENGWGKFASNRNTSGTSGGIYNWGAAAIFRHPIFNTICNGAGLNDFTIEFNIRIVGDGNAGTYGSALKVFPFSFVGSSTIDVFSSVATANQPAGTKVLSTGGDSVSNNAVEMGMTIGSHAAPGGFGFGVGKTDGSNVGYAAACTNNDTNPNSFVNRGIAPIGTGNSSTWGPYYMAVVRKNGVVSIFVNGKKVHAPTSADENGVGQAGGATSSGNAVPETNSTWDWNTFKFDTTDTLQNAADTFDAPLNHNPTAFAAGGGLIVGGCMAYSNYGQDDDLYLQHFRITNNVARYTSDFIPEPIYTV